MQAHNVNRKLEQPSKSFWDGYAEAAPRIHEHEQPAPGTGPWLEIGQLDLFCSGCNERSWQHTCWSERTVA
jgi:hypothetical protein